MNASFGCMIGSWQDLKQSGGRVLLPDCGGTQAGGGCQLRRLAGQPVSIGEPGWSYAGCWLVAWVGGARRFRNLVAADLDLDGRMDLVVTTQESWPSARQRLLIYHNQLDPDGWAGLQLGGHASWDTGAASNRGPKSLRVGCSLAMDSVPRDRCGTLRVGRDAISGFKVYQPGRPVQVVRPAVAETWTSLPDSGGGRESRF